jgi:HSP20 family molecular chaperone IbpA
MHARAEAREYLVDLDLPALRPEDLEVTLHGRVVSIHACGRRVRSFRLPDAVDADGLAASYRGGRLRLRARSVALVTRVIPLEDGIPHVDPDAEPV